MSSEAHEPVSPLQLILDEHNCWIQSKGQRGKKADFKGKGFAGENLQGRDLRGANLEEANFSRCNLAGANLSGCVAQGAEFKNADLQYADLEDVENLLPSQFTGADLRGAKVSERVAKPASLESAVAVSRFAQNVLLTSVVANIYCWITLGAANDAQLIADATPLHLPVLQVSVSIRNFFIAAPLLLAGLYIGLQLSVQRFWELIANLPAVFPGGERLDDSCNAWFFGGYVSSSYEHLKKSDPGFSRLRQAASVFTIWWLTPISLFLFWSKYIPVREPTIILIHIAIIVGCVAVGSYALTLARKTLSGIGHNDDSAVSTLVPVITVAIALGSLSYYFVLKPPSSIGTDPWIERACTMEERLVRLEFADAEISKKLQSWEDNDPKVGLVERANLRKKNLRYADASNAFLVRADLREADLRLGCFEGADLRLADLREAKLSDTDLTLAKLVDANFSSITNSFFELERTDLSRAILRGADLSRAKLESANLESAQLDCDGVLGERQCTRLDDADLAGAQFVNANIEGASVYGANLSGANLTGARLEGANFEGAIFGWIGGSDAVGTGQERTNLSGVDLRGVSGLTQEQLIKACGDQDTKLLAGWTIDPCPEYQ